MKTLAQLEQENADLKRMIERLKGELAKALESNTDLYLAAKQREGAAA